LSFHYRKGSNAVFEHVNLEVKSGETIVLLGENGIGKTSLLKLLAGLVKPTSGLISLKNKSIADWNQQKLAVELALVLTHANLMGMLRVDEFIAFGRFPYTNWIGKLKDSDKSIIEQCIVDCELTHLRNKSIHELSDGELQKVFMARALAQQTNILILDEPTTHLDVKNTTTQLKLLKQLSEKEGKTILFSSHQFDLALQIATKVWLFDGNTVHQITPAEFYDDCKYQEILLGKDYLFDKSSNRFSIKL
jgi:iron complex transport system ATP-binding protein